MIKNKKAMTQSFVVGIIISVITLIILLFIIKTNIDSFRYTQSIQECKLFFENIDGKALYFSNELNKPTLSLTDSIAKLCPSKTIKINKKSVSDAAKLLNDCYVKTAKGENIMGSNTRGEKICLYCGKIEAEEEITNFRELLTKELNDEKYNSFMGKDNNEFKDTINLNSGFYSQTSSIIPQKLSKDMSATIFYYIDAPEFPKTDNIGIITWIKDVYGTKLSKFVGSMGSIGSWLNWKITQGGISEYDVFSGVIITHQSEAEIEFGKTKNTIQFRDCNTIIPEDNFG